MQAPHQQLHPNGPQQPQQQQQQPQPHPAMAGAPPQYVLPPNLTRDQVQAMVQEWSLMKRQGETDANPRYAQLNGQLMAIQRAQHLRTQQQQQHQQLAQHHQHQQHQQHMHQQQQHQQQQQMHQQMHQMAQNTPQHPQAPPQQQRPVEQQQGSPIMNLHRQENGVNGTPGTPVRAGPVGAQAFTPDQLFALKNQILAFKKVSKGLPLPDAVQQAVLGTMASKGTPQPEHQALAHSTPLQPSAANQSPVQPYQENLNAVARILEQQKQSSPVVSQQSILAPPAIPLHAVSDEPPVMSPHQFFNRKISMGEHAQRTQRPIIPAIFPTGIDAYAMQDCYARAKDNRIAARIQELENLDPNTIDFPSANETTNGIHPRRDTYTQKSKLRALIELKSLKMVEKQRLLRKVMSRAISRLTHLSTAPDRALYRRQKKVSMREARLTENLEKQQRVDRERREKQKHDDYLHGILHHGREVLTGGKLRVQRFQRLGKGVLQFHSHVEKEEQRRIERTAKLRLAALKNDDEEAYLKLIDQAKDTRITHLLKQTSSYLDGLAAAVAKQQHESGVASSIEDEEDEDGESKVDYYAVAHRINEEVTEQPGLLVGGRLKDYQVKGLQWMVSLFNNHLNGILADEMGLGKTIQTISLLTFLMEKKNVPGPFLVIVPLSTMTNWSLEFARWAPSMKIICYKGAPPARRNLANQVRGGNWQVLLTTYEFIIKDRAILSKTKWVYMIIDEGHRMKNTKSKLAQTLSQYYYSRYRLILTGTPLQNNLPELWAILNFALPKIFNSVKSFDEWFNTPFANTGAQDEMKLTEEETILIVKRLHKVLRPFLLRRLKKDVESELPDKVERVVKCRMSSLQSRLYAQMKAEGIISSEAGKGFRGLNNTVMQLKKICNHPFVFEEVENAMNPHSITNDLIWRVSGKFELLDRVLPKFKKSGHRILMFFQMTQIMNIMEDFLLLRGYQYLRLDGSTKADDRTQLLERFNAEPDLFVFILSTRAGGLGLNLQVADTVIIYDSDWNPHQDLQAQDRAHRIGQTKEVRILRLITEKSIEESILARAQEKLDLDGKVIQAGRFDNKSTNEEREVLLRALFESREEGSDSDEEEEMDDDELNEILARNDDELVLFKKLDKERDRESPYGKNKQLPRLITEDELPVIYQENNELLRKAKAQEEVFLGRGFRDRGEVVYTDGLTDDQWVQAIDNEEDVDELARVKRERKQKRIENKRKRESSHLDIPDSPASDVSNVRKRGRATKSESVEPSVLAPDSTIPSSKKNKNKRQRIHNSEETVDSPAPAPKKPRGRGRPPLINHSDPLDPKRRRQLNKILDAVYDAVIDVTDEDGRDRSELFMELPDKREYRDYYAIIKRPISLEMIRKRINGNHYTSLQGFKEDFRTIFQNARQYNEEGSLVVEDADALETEFNRKLEEVTNGDTTTGGITFDSPADSPMPTNVSNSPEPMARTSFKLKIKPPARPIVSSDSGSDDE